MGKDGGTADAEDDNLPPDAATVKELLASMVSINPLTRLASSVPTATAPQRASKCA